MKNCNMKIVKTPGKGNVLQITIDLDQEQGASKSGKTMIIATTEGNMQVPGAPEGVKIGLNVYKPAPTEG